MVRLRKAFGKRVAWLAGGSALSQALLVLLVPLIARETDPASYGLYALVAAAAITAAGVFTLRLELAIPATRTRLQALESAVVAATLLVSLTIAGSAAAVASGPLWPAGLYPGDALVGAAGVAALLFGMLQTGRLWATRLGLERWSALAQLTRTFVMLVAQLALLAAGWGALGLVVGQATGSLAAVALLALLFPRRRLGRLTLRRLRRRLRENREYAWYSTPSFLSSVLGTQAPVYLLASFFGLPLSGAFALVMRVLGAPAGLLSQAVGLVVFSEASKSFHAGRPLHALVARVADALLPAAVAIYAAVAVFADPVLVWVLGEEWRGAAPVAVALSPWFALTFLVTGLNGLPLVTGRQRELLGLTGAGTAFRVGVLAVFGLLGDPALALWGYGLAGALVAFVTLVWFFRWARVERSWAWRFWLRSAGEACLLAVAFWALGQSTILLGVVAAGAVALGVSWLHLRKLVAA